MEILIHTKFRKIGTIKKKIAYFVASFIIMQKKLTVDSVIKEPLQSVLEGKDTFVVSP